MGKEMWFREFERLYKEKMDAGIPAHRAYTEAGDQAGPALAEKLADHADYLRKAQRENGQ